MANRIKPKAKSQKPKVQEPASMPTFSRKTGWPAIACSTLLAFGFWLLPLHAAPQAPPASATDFARLLQAHYNTVKDFTADFTHQYRCFFHDTATTESGQLKVKKP